MKVAFKIIVLSFFLVGIIFARNGKNNPRVEENKVNSEHYFVKGHSENGNDQVNGERSHKRRRRVRKPTKGLR